MTGTNTTLAGGSFGGVTLTDLSTFRNLDTNGTPNTLISGTNAVYAIGGGISGLTDHTLMKIRFDAVTATPISLAVIVSDICQGCGLTTDQIDVTSLTDYVDGYMISRQEPARSNIQQLALGFLFDGVESDDKLKFVNRVGASVVSIPDDDLAACSIVIAPLGADLNGKIAMRASSYLDDISIYLTLKSVLRR